MRNILLATTALLALSALPANATVTFESKLSGTGDNVIFDSFTAGSHTAVGKFNGQHTDIVNFTDLTNSSTFSGAQSGNDIKINGTNNLLITLFDANGHSIGTTTEVFSLSGTGDIHAFVQAVDKNGVAEPIQNFDLGELKKNAQNGFTFTASDGEVITSLRILETTPEGSITDFEHFRVDIAPIPTEVTAVPEPSTWAMMILGFFGIAGMAGRKQWKVFA